MAFTKEQAASFLNVEYLDAPAAFGVEDAAQILGLLRGEYNPALAGTVAAYLDGTVRGIVSVSTSADAASAIVSLINAIADSAIQTSSSQPVVADTVLLATRTVTSSADGIAQLANLTIDTSVDVYVSQRYTILLYLDAVVLPPTVVYADVDVAASVINTASLDSDAVLSIVPDVTTGADSSILATVGISTDTDAALIEIDMIETVSMDTLVFNYNPFLPAPTGEYAAMIRAVSHEAMVNL